MPTFVTHPCVTSNFKHAHRSVSRTPIYALLKPGAWRLPKSGRTFLRMGLAEGEPKESQQGSTEKRPTSGKELAARYGGAYLGTSISLSLISFGVLYALIAAGVDVRGGIIALGDWLAGTPLGRPKVLDNISEAGGTFALAYIAHKATSPLRFPPTLVATEFVARALKKAKSNEQEDEGKDVNTE